jgi:FkbM family methyltransferase
MRSTHLARFVRFTKKSSNQKRESLAWYGEHLWNRIRRKVPVIKRIEPGFLFVVWSDVVRESVLRGEFEKTEREFVTRFLEPGMTVLDVGAYFGIYALTASAKVGRHGRVIAFEPSAHQMRRLRWNLRLNRCSNVHTEKLALSSVEGEADFFVPVRGGEGYSSLRRPEVPGVLRSTRVGTVTLDKYLRDHGIERVDFIKVDVEGGELDFFKGARNLLERADPPVILCELQDIRSKAWGHTALEVAEFVQGFGYQWFKPFPNGTVRPVPASQACYDGNFVAVPPERIAQLREMFLNEPCS